MEKITDAYCHIQDTFSFTILDFIGCFILFIIMRWIDNKLENRSLFPPALFFQFLLSYLVDKVCPKNYITLILSYMYISVCKSILLNILKIVFPIVARNRGKVVWSILARLLITCSFSKIFFSLVTRNRGKVICSILACLLVTSSFPKIVFSLFVRNQWKVVWSILAFLLISSSFLLESALFVMLRTVLNCILTVVNNYYLKYLAFFGFFIPHTNSSSCPIETVQETSDNEIDINNMSLSRDELKTVMEKLCQFSDEEGDKIGDYMMGRQEFCALFEDSEPSLDEIRESFSIFDKDRDGFIDARDLQIVLINLGLPEGTNMNTCQHMIEQYGRGGGGKINSTDFCRLLELAFYKNGTL